MSGGETTRRLVIDGTVIADDTGAYVIAEVGHNHQGSVATAKQLFEEAMRCGADAVKLQKRDNRTLYTSEFFHKPYEHENSFGATYGEHREALEFGRAEYAGADRLRARDRHHVPRHRLRPAERGLPRRPRRAGVQARLRRSLEHPAPAACRGDRQADDHLHRRPRRSTT